MRKIFLPLLAALLLPIAAMAQTPACTTNCQITESWQLPSGVTQLPACSSTVKTSCGSAWTLTHTAGSSTVVTDSSTIPWTTLTFTEPVPANNTATTWNFTLVGNWVDANGATQTTAQATCGSANTAPPCATSNIPNTVPGPINFTVTVTAAPAK